MSPFSPQTCYISELVQETTRSLTSKGDTEGMTKVKIDIAFFGKVTTNSVRPTLRTEKCV